MKDLYNNLEVTSLLDPIAVTSIQTIDDIDLAGFNSACLVIALGLNGGTTPSSSHQIAFVLWDSADGDTYAVVETADMLDLTVTAGAILTTDAAAKYSVTYKFGYVGGKRYLRLIGTVTGSVSAITSISLIKGHPLDAPVA